MAAVNPATAATPSATDQTMADPDPRGSDRDQETAYPDRAAGHLTAEEHP